MTIAEASSKSGFAPFTISQACNHGELLATKPRGNRGGWEISDGALVAWLQSKRLRGANKPLREAIKRGVAA